MTLNNITIINKFNSNMAEQLIVFPQNKYAEIINKRDCRCRADHQEIYKGMVSKKEVVCDLLAWSL